MATWLLITLTTTSLVPWRMLWNYAWEYRRYKELAEIRLEMAALRKQVQEREFIFVDSAEGDCLVHESSCPCATTGSGVSESNKKTNDDTNPHTAVT